MNISWVMSAVVTVLLAVVPAMFRLSNRLALTEERMEQNWREIGDEKIRNDLQDERLLKQGEILGRLESKLDLVIQALQKSGMI